MEDIKVNVSQKIGTNIVVIGSANMDTTHYLEGEFPEELTGESTNNIIKTMRVLGGKGANQAVSSKKQVRDFDNVSFIGCIGKDEAGLKMIQQLKDLGIDYSGVKVLPDKATDGRIIYVDKNGNNRMIGYGDCIKELTPEVLQEEKIALTIENADIVMIQMKMPAETVRYIVEYCSRTGKQIIIDPTPLDKSYILAEDGEELLKQATYLTPNEEEAYALAGYLEGKTVEEVKASFKAVSEEERKKVIMELVEKYPSVISTMGGQGVIYNNSGRVIEKETYPTECKDSTGAGDTFNGAFAAALARRETLEEAIQYGLMASSIKVRYEGAQNGMPTYQETRTSLRTAEQTQL